MEEFKNKIQNFPETNELLNPEIESFPWIPDKKYHRLIKSIQHFQYHLVFILFPLQFTWIINYKNIFKNIILCLLLYLTILMFFYVIFIGVRKWVIFNQCFKVDSGFL